MFLKKAQAWGFDVVIALVIFMAGIIVFFLYSLNFPNESQDKLEILLYEGNIIADSLLTPGFPENWNENQVTKIGLTTNNKINQSKLDNLYQIVYTNNNYNLSRSILDTQYQYFFNFSEPMEINGSPIPEAGIGLLPGTEAQNIIKVSRLTIYKERPIRMDVYIWD